MLIVMVALLSLVVSLLAKPVLRHVVVYVALEKMHVVISTQMAQSLEALQAKVSNLEKSHTFRQLYVNHFVRIRITY